MKSNWFRRIIIFLGIVIIDIILLGNAYSLCSRYPFSRLLSENKLTITVKFANNDSLYGATIIDSACLDSLKKTPQKKEGKSQWEILLKKADGTQILYFVSKSFNIDFFIFLTILIVTGTIHLVWGVIIFMVKKINTSAKYYSYFSIIFGLLIFSYADFICTGKQLFLLIMHTAFYYWAVSGICEMFRISAKIRKFISSLILSFILAVFSFYLFTASSIANIRTFQFFIVSFLILLFAVIATAIFRSKKGLGSIRSYPALFLSIATGLVLPLSAILYASHHDLPVPVPVFALITSIIPLTLGRGFIERSHLTEYVIKTIYNIRFLIDFITALILGQIFYIYTLRLTTHYNSILYISIASALLLIIRAVIIDNLRGIAPASGDKLTLSLQLIAEISVLPKALEKRLESIFAQVYSHLSISHFKIYIVATSSTPRLEKYDKYFSYIDSSELLAKEYENYRDIIRKDYLFDNYKANYFAGNDKKDYTIIIPVEFEAKIQCLIFASDKPKSTPFYSSEFNYMQSSALLVYQMIENELLFQQYLLKGKYEEELDKASYTQMRLFPVELPLSSGIDISFYLRPFNKVTGDYFDIVSMPDNKSAIVIGDITGHGLPAAMLHSTTAALVNALLREGASIPEVMEYINTFLIEKYRGHELITLLIALFDPANRSLRYVNAGHNLPLHYIKKTNTIESLHQRNHILGVMDSPSYKESTIALDSGDKLFLYTDGLVDIRKENGHSLGEKPVITLLYENAAKTGEVLIEKISQLVESSDQEDIPDDITVVCISID